MRKLLALVALAGCGPAAVEARPDAAQPDEVIAACIALESCGLYGWYFSRCLINLAWLDDPGQFQPALAVGLDLEARRCLAAVHGCAEARGCLGILDEVPCTRDRCDAYGLLERCWTDGERVVTSAFECPPPPDTQCFATDGGATCARPCDTPGTTCEGSLVQRCANGVGWLVDDCALHGATCAVIGGDDGDGGVGCVGIGPPCDGRLPPICEHNVLVSCVGGREARVTCAGVCAYAPDDVLGDPYNFPACFPSWYPDLPRLVCDGSLLTIERGGERFAYDCAAHGLGTCGFTDGGVGPCGNAP